MKKLRNVLAFLTVAMAVTAGLMIVFRDQIKVAAVRKFVENWTDDLLEGATMDASEKKSITTKIGEFYALAVDNVIPDRSVEELWEDGVKNLGLWYFYLKNQFTRTIQNSKLDVAGRKKANEVIDKFLSYIKDGRVRRSDIETLGEQIDLQKMGQPGFEGMSKEDIERAVRKMEALNVLLEKKGPGKPMDPVASFKTLVEQISAVSEKYAEKEKKKEE